MPSATEYDEKDMFIPGWTRYSNWSFWRDGEKVLLPRGHMYAALRLKKKDDGAEVMDIYVNFYLEKGYEAEVTYEFILACGNEEILRKIETRKMKIEDNANGWTGTPENFVYKLPNESRLKTRALDVRVNIKSWKLQKN